MHSPDQRQRVLADAARAELAKSKKAAKRADRARTIDECSKIEQVSGFEPLTVCL